MGVNDCSFIIVTFLYFLAIQNPEAEKLSTELYEDPMYTFEVEFYLVL